MTNGPCPSEQQIAAFVDGTLSTANRYQVQQHLDTCSACFDVAATVASLGGHAPPVVDPALRAAVSASPRSPWMMRALPAMSAAAVFLVAIAWWNAPSQPGPSVTPPPAQIAPSRRPADAVRSNGTEAVIRLEQPRDGEVVTGRPELRWSGPADATSYEVQVTTAAGDVLWKRQVEGAQHLLRLDTELPAGRRCHIWVAAYLAEGRRVTSNVVSVTTAER